MYRWGFVGPERVADAAFDSQLTITLREAPGDATELTLVHERLETIDAAMPGMADATSHGRAYALRSTPSLPHSRKPRDDRLPGVDAPAAAPERHIVLGLVAEPGVSAELAKDLAAELPEHLSQHVSDRVEWEVPVVVEPLDTAGGGGIELIEAARRLMMREGWDMGIALTDLPIRIGRRPVVADASAQHRIGIISLPALGALHLNRRAREAVLRLVEGLVGESMELDAAGAARTRRVGRRLVEMAAPVRRVAPADGDVDIRFVAAVVRGHLRLLAGMVRANRPWRLIAGLSRALAASLAAVAFAIVTADIWRLADDLSWPRLLAITVMTIVATVVWLIADHDLWEWPSGRASREQVVLFNAATAATVALGVVFLYLALYVLTLVAAELVITSHEFGSRLGHPVDFGDYVKLAWFVSSLATVGGALGSGLESDEAVREAAYGYRPDRGSEQRL
ncbi:MAG TPA: hypothetical protein VF752_00610 [Thermoleophilaceae bacterium]